MVGAVGSLPTREMEEEEVLVIAQVGIPGNTGRGGHSLRKASWEGVPSLKINRPGIPQATPSLPEHCIFICDRA